MENWAEPNRGPSTPRTAGRLFTARKTRGTGEAGKPHGRPASSRRRRRLVAVVLAAAPESRQHASRGARERRDGSGVSPRGGGGGRRPGPRVLLRPLPRRAARGEGVRGPGVHRPRPLLRLQRALRVRQGPRYARIVPLACDTTHSVRCCCLLGADRISDLNRQHVAVGAGRGRSDPKFRICQLSHLGCGICEERFDVRCVSCRQA